MEKTQFHLIPNNTRIKVKLRPEYEKNGYVTDLYFMDGYFYPYDQSLKQEPEFYLGDISHFCESYKIKKQG